MYVKPVEEDKKKRLTIVSKVRRHYNLLTVNWQKPFVGPLSQKRWLIRDLIQLIVIRDTYPSRSQTTPTSKTPGYLN